MKKILYKLLGTILSLYFIYSGVVYFMVFNSAKTVDEIQNQEFLHFIIYGSSTSDDGNTVSARFTIVDYKGDSITEIERSWSGNYLAVEFNQSKLLNKYFIFPNKIFAKNRIIEGNRNRKKGTYLEKYYDENNECILLGKRSLKKNREKLLTISRFTNKKYLVPTFGLVDTYVLDLSNCEADVFYTISSNEKGKIILRRM